MVMRAETAGTAPAPGRTPWRRAAPAALVLVLAAHALHAQGTKPSPIAEPAQLYEQALRHFDHGRLEESVLALKDALSADPALLPAHVLLARIYLRIGEPAAAEESLLRARRMGADPDIVWPLQAQAMYRMREYQKLLALTPREGLHAEPQATVLVYRGRARLERGEFEQAREELRRAAALTPSAPLPQVSMAVTALREGDVHAAEARALKATRVAPQDADAWNALGDVAHVRGELDAALEAYQRALERAPDHYEARLSRAGIYLDLGRLEEAEADLAVLRERAPLEPRPAYLQAVLLSKQGRVAESREALERATALLDELGPGALARSTQLMLLAGLAHYELGELEQAQGQVAAYVERFPALPGPRKLLAAILLRNGRSAEAVSVLEPALEQAPDDYRLLGLLGKAYLQRRRYDLATGYLERAVARSGGAPELRADLALARVGEGFEQQGLEALAAVFEEAPRERGRIGVVLASLQLRRGDYGGALATARLLGQAWPRDATVANLAGSAELGAGRVEEARASFHRALALDPDFLPARINLGILEARRGSPQQAIRILNEVLQREPGSTRAMVELAAVHDRLGRRADALRWLEKARASDPDSRKAAIALIDLRLSAGDTDEAMRVAGQAESRAPEDLDVLAALARVHVAQGREDLALGVYQRMSLLAGFDAGELLRIARLQSRLGADEDAMFSLHKAVQNEPGEVEARLMLARLQTRAGRLEQARENLAVLLEKAPQRAGVLRAAGDLAMAAGDAAAAAEHYRRAAALEPESRNVLRVFRARVAAGDLAGAVSLLEQRLAAEPQDVEALRALAETHLARGQLAAAHRRYEQALEQRPHDPGLLNNMAFLLDITGDARALSYAERALAASPEDPAVLDTLGWLLVRNGDPARGLGYLRDAHSRASSNPEIRYHIAAALAALDRKDEARRELERALQAAQPFQGIADARALLESLAR